VHKFSIAVTLVLASYATAQQKPAQADDKPQIKVNILNVCGPSPEEQAVLNVALARVPEKPSFIEDFELARGRTTLKDTAPAKYVRLRKEFPSESPMLTAQYSMSADNKTIVELLVLRTRDPKEFHEISLEGRASAEAAAPLVVLAADTPPARIRVERLGKSSVVLTRCDGSDQSAYESLFRQASEIMSRYRRALGLRGAFRGDFAWLGEGKTAPTTNKKSPK
jgi:hypothetical protein